MSFESAVTQLEQTNAQLVQEVVRVRDAAMGMNRLFPTVTEGRETVADGQYFTVPGDGDYLRLYRRVGVQAELITDYPTKAAFENALAQAQADAAALEANAQASADAAADSATLASNLADAVAEATATYTSVSEGLAATMDGDFFRVIEAPTARELTLYRNDAGAETEIGRFYAKGGVDARAAAATRLARSLQRRGDSGQTLHSDFAAGAYGLGSKMAGGVEQALEGEELWTCERATSKWVWQPSGPNGEMRLTEVPPNVLARHWDPLNGEALGVLVEDSRTNLFLRSSDASQGSGGNATVTLDAAMAPDGRQAADLIEDTSDTSTQYWQATRFGVDDTEFPPGTYSGSIFIKKFDSRYCRLNFQIYGTVAYAKNVIFDFDTGLPSSSEFSVDPMPDGWFRLSSTITTADSNQYCRVLIYPAYGDVSQDEILVGGCYVWGAQLEVGGDVTSYIPTFDSIVTRAADDLSRVVGGEFNHNAGTAFVEFEVKYFPDNTSSIFSINDGSLSGRLLEISLTPPGNLVFLSSGVGSIVRSAALGSTYRAAISCDGYSLTAAIDGLGLGTEEGAYNGGLSERLEIGWLAASSSRRCGISVKSYKYHPHVMSQPELEALTS